MSFILKLINSPDETTYYEIKYNLHNSMTLKLLYELFNFLGLSYDVLRCIKFIIDTDQIGDDDEYNIIDEDRNIYIFTMDEDIKLKLYHIFIKEGYKTNVSSLHDVSDDDDNDDRLYKYHNDTDNETSSSDTDNETSSSDTDIDSYISAPITQTPTNPELTPIMTPEIITTINVKAVSLFADPDFKNLIKIYMTKPDLFKTFAKYIQNGDIIANDQIIKTIEDLDGDELIHYQGLADQIHALGLELPNELIINQLIKYSGHLNLTVRSLLLSI